MPTHKHGDLPTTRCSCPATSARVLRSWLREAGEEKATPFGSIPHGPRHPAKAVRSESKRTDPFSPLRSLVLPLELGWGRERSPPGSSRLSGLGRSRWKPHLDTSAAHLKPGKGFASVREEEPQLRLCPPPKRAPKPGLLPCPSSSRPQAPFVPNSSNKKHKPKKTRCERKVMGSVLWGAAAGKGAVREPLETRRRILVQDHQLLLFLTFEGVPLSSACLQAVLPLSTEPSRCGRGARLHRRRVLPPRAGARWRFQTAHPLLIARGLVAGRQPALLPHPLPCSRGGRCPAFPPPPPRPAAGTAAILDAVEHPRLRDAQGLSVPAPPAAEADEAPAFPAVTRPHFHSRLQMVDLGLGRSSARSSPSGSGLPAVGTGTGCRSLLPPRQLSPLWLIAGRASWRGAPPAPSPTRGTPGC